MAATALKALIASGLVFGAATVARAAEFPLSAQAPVYAAPLQDLGSAMALIEGRSALTSHWLGACAPADAAMFPIGSDTPCAPAQIGVAFDQAG